MNRRTQVLYIILMVLLGVVAFWSYGYMDSQRKATAETQAALEQCRHDANRIQQLAGRPSVASDSERLASEMTACIESAAKTAGIPVERLVRIDPSGQPSRLGDTAYKEKPTQTYVKNVTIRQAASMIHNILAAKDGLAARSIRVSAARPEDADDAWDLELSVTYLIYDPPTSQK